MAATAEVAVATDAYAEVAAAAAEVEAATKAANRVHCCNTARRSRGEVILLRREIWTCYQKSLEFAISITECGALGKKSAHNHLCVVICSAIMDTNNGRKWKVEGEGETKPLYSNI